MKSITNDLQYCTFGLKNRAEVDLKKGLEIMLKEVNNLNEVINAKVTIG